MAALLLPFFACYKIPFHYAEAAAGTLSVVVVVVVVTAVLGPFVLAIYYDQLNYT